VAYSADSGNPPDLDLALAREAAHPLDRLPPRRHVDQPVPGRQRGVFRGDRRAVLDDTSTIGQFLDWLTGDQKVRLMRWGTRQDPDTGHTWETWVPDHRSIEQLLADYFGLDLDAIGASSRRSTPSSPSAPTPRRPWALHPRRSQPRATTRPRAP